MGFLQGRKETESDAKKNQWKHLNTNIKKQDEVEPILSTWEWPYFTHSFYFFLQETISFFTCK